MLDVNQIIFLLITKAQDWYYVFGRSCRKNTSLIAASNHMYLTKHSRVITNHTHVMSGEGRPCEFFSMLSIECDFSTSRVVLFQNIFVLGQ